MNNIENIEKLLKSEISATETYEQALEKFSDEVELGESGDLMPLHENHLEAVSSLEQLITQLGGTVPESSGVWGVWSKMVMGGANLLGKEAVLKALQSGEKSGAEEYEEALQESDLHPDVRSLIETKLYPAQQEHIRTLDRLLDAA
jgi:uncharacterized protein (TIGR02284 family)